MLFSLVRRRGSVTSEAMAYLDEALDYIQEHALKREQIDWPLFRQEISLLVPHAQKPADTYFAIERALERLGDHHSLFLDPASEQLRVQEKIKQVGLHAIYPEGI